MFRIGYTLITMLMVATYLYSGLEPDEDGFAPLKEAIRGKDKFPCGIIDLVAVKKIPKRM